ncbi:MAG: toxin-antitoxin system YwqK family antitoxin [Thermoplasmatota archaeon]
MPARIPGVTGQLDARGRRHGRWKFYHRDGKLWSSGTYVHGVAHGLFRWYAANGKLRQSGRFAHGKQSGLWTRRYGGTTQLFDIGRWDNGKKIGVWKTFARDGRVKRLETFAAKRKAKR